MDTSGGTTSHLVYQDTSYRHWHAAFTGTWSTPDAIGGSATPYYGPFAATIAANGANASAAFFDGSNNNLVTTTDLTGGAWGARNGATGTTPSIVGNGQGIVIPTAIVTLSGGGPSQMLAYVDQNQAIQFVTRTGTTWSSPTAITNCYAGDPVALAPLPGGGAILAFRGIDSPSTRYLYWTVYSGGSWSAVAPFASPNAAIDASPAVAHGIPGDLAEIAYISSGVAYHARLIGSSWSSPVAVGGSGLSAVAIASAP